MELIDDHARFLLAAVACEAPTGGAALACLEQAVYAYGVRPGECQPVQLEHDRSGLPSGTR